MSAEKPEALSIYAYETATENSIDPEVYQGYQSSAARRTLATSPQPPSADVIDALEDGLVNVIRRVEIYEADGATQWNPAADTDADFARIIDGNVNVDSSADERRTFDLTLDNRDLLLKPDPFDGLWYDKIIKVFRGVAYTGGAVAPRVAIIDAPSTADGKVLKQFLTTCGYIDIDIVTAFTTADQLRPYPVIVSFTGAGAGTTKMSVLKQMWGLGHHVFTIGTGNRAGDIPHYFDDVAVAGGSWNIKPTDGDTPVDGAFVTGPGGAGSGYAPLTASVGVLVLALGDNPTDGTPAITAALATAVSGGYWVDLHLPTYVNPQPKLFLRAISDWVRGVGLEMEWETQIGEFMIDGLSWANFPDQVKVTGRDYVKKMKQSKLAQTATFAVGTRLRDLVIALAANSGIDGSRMRVGIGDELLTTEMSYEAGTDRWQIAKDACDSYNYEIYFDAFGWLVVRKYIDPYAGLTSWTFKTGEDGNLVSFDKTLSDSEIYNHVIVRATPAEGEDVLPYFGEAKNEDPTSPTCIQRLGDRVLIIDADYLNSNLECQSLAKDRLKIVALEQYALNTTVVYYPWLEVGEISEILDPDAGDTEPTRYLLDTLSYPLALGPMSGTAKRITIVGDTGNPETDVA